MVYLSILEVSQKQAYIFSSNKLKDNIQKSAEIVEATSLDFLVSSVNDSDIFDKRKNYVYSGGGHIVLEFDDEEKVKEFHKRVSRKTHQIFPKMDIFMTYRAYDHQMDPGKNLSELIKKLEAKKSLRKSGFKQGTYAVEEVDSNTLKVNPVPSADERDKAYEIESRTKMLDADLLRSASIKYEPPYQFNNLGGSEGESSYIAVVHIDGNGMGKRVAEFYESRKHKSWDEFKEDIRVFSEAIDEDFRQSFVEMCFSVGKYINSVDPCPLDIQNHFPLRRIILSGDDVCFVSDGRIGIDAAAEFIRIINNKVNRVDGKKYAACAGVSIVHQKYPFFRAYSLAEALCSNAKKFGARLEYEVYGSKQQTNGASISSIDWHIEQGELEDSVDDIRSEYKIPSLSWKSYEKEFIQLELRPFMIHAPQDVLEKEKARTYRVFKKLMKKVKRKGDQYIRGKLKGLREYYKDGEAACENYISFHRLSDIVLDTYQGIFEELKFEIATGTQLKRELFIRTFDGVRRSTLFDAIDIMDCFIDLESEEE